MSLARDIADLGAVTSRLDTVGSSSGALSNRNIIVNFCMTISQRSTQSTNAGSGYITVDRFYHELKNSTDNLTFTTEQVTDAPSGFSKSLKLTVTTAESALAADEYGRMYYVVEGQDLQRIGYGTSACKEVTLSFYVKSSITGNFSASIYLSASGGVIANQAYTINSADTWERKTLTFPTYTTANVPNTNAAGMYINFGLFAGSNYTTAASTFVAHTGAHLLGGQAANWAAVNSTTWQLTGVQLEVGDTATDFEHRTFGDELRRCQRYFYALLRRDMNEDQQIGSYYSTTRAFINVPHKVSMRTAPTISVVGSVGADIYSAGASISTTTLANSYPRIESTGLDFTPASSGTAGNAFHLDWTITASTSYIEANAEL